MKRCHYTLLINLLMKSRRIEKNVRKTNKNQLQTLMEIAS